MKKKFKISLISIISIVLILVAIFFYSSIKNFDNKLFNKIPEENKGSGIGSGNEILKTQNNSQPTASDSAVGGSESSSKTSSPSNSSCYDEQATYSIGNINEYYFCNSEEAGSCIDKTAKCSVKVQNLDITLSGNFEIKFSFFEKENRSNIIETTLSNSFISPNEEKILKAELVIQGSNANKNISCYYSTTEVPNKKICS